MAMNKIVPTTNPVEQSEFAEKQMQVNIFAYWEGDNNAEHVNNMVELTGNRAWYYAGKGYVYECKDLTTNEVYWLSVQCLTEVE